MVLPQHRPIEKWHRVFGSWMANWEESQWSRERRRMLLIQSQDEGEVENTEHGVDAYNLWIWSLPLTVTNATKGYVLQNLKMVLGRSQAKH